MKNVARVLSLLIVLASTADAAARSRTVVLPFSGPKSGRVHDAVVDALRRHRRVEVLRAGALFSAAQRLGYERKELADEISLSIVAGEIRADAIVRGRTSRNRSTRKWSLTVTVHDGGTGGVIGRHTVALVRGRADKTTARRIVAVSIPSIVKGTWRPPSSGTEPSDPLRRAPLGDPLGDPLADPLAGPAPDHRGRLDTAPRPVGLVEAPAPWSGPNERGPSGENLALEVGFIGLVRVYALEGGVTPDGVPLTHKYESGVYPGLWLRSELYPFALGGERGAIADLGIEAYLDHGSIESELRVVDRNGNEEERVGVDTRQQMWGAGLVYRLFPGETQAGPIALRLLLGYHGASFALSERTPLYERNDYDAFRVGADAWIPVGRSEEWLFSLRGRLAPLWIRAGLNDDEAYPPTTGLGWEMAGGLDVELDEQWSVTGDYRLYSYPAEYEAKSAANPRLSSSDGYHGFVVQVRYRQ